MAVSAELAAQRRQTAAFIAADPLVVVLERKLRVRTDSGGYEDATTPLAPQTIRLIPTTDRTPQIETADGSVVIPAFTLMATVDVDLKRGDVFVLEDGYEYQLEGPKYPMHTQNAYEQKIGVIRRGRRG